MKTKTAVLLVTAILSVVCVIFLAISDNTKRNPAWEQIVSETHRRIRILKEKPYNDLLKDSDIHIEALNLVKGYKEEYLAKLLPTIVFPTWHGRIDDALEMISSAQLWLVGHSISIYDLGLSAKEKKQLIQSCNSSECRVRTVDLKQFPSHVRNLQLEAYRPLVIQMELNYSGAALFTNPGFRFVPHAQSILNQLLPQARKVGIVGWPQNDSTSAVTHPRLFTYFGLTPQKYYFHRTIAGDHLLVYYTPTIRQRVMTPWMQCSLTFDCISPIGALEQGCSPRIYRRPRYLYAGCHQFDLSALNVVLGRAFGYVADSYLTKFSLFNANDKRGYG